MVQSLQLPSCLSLICRRSSFQDAATKAGQLRPQDTASGDHWPSSAVAPMSSNGSTHALSGCQRLQMEHFALLSAVPLLALGLDKPHIIDGSIARRTGDVDFIGLGWVMRREGA